MSDTNQTTTQQQPAPEEGVEPMGVNSIALALWGATSVAIVVGAMFVAVALTHEIENHLNQSRVIEATNTAAKDAILAQQGVLTSAPIAEGDSFRIPLSLAKKLVVEELQAQQ